MLTVEEVHSQWLDLDHVLVRLWELHQLCVKVIWDVDGSKTEVMHDQVKSLSKCLLPKTTTKDGIELDVTHSEHDETS